MGRQHKDQKNPYKYKRVVIKIGSALLVDVQSGLRQAWLSSLCSDINDLTKQGVEVLIVSSGAIAMGRTILNLPKGALKLEQSQAAAAVGQIALGRAYDEKLQGHQLSSGQILLTLSDTETRRRYLNARATINTLLEWGAVPIINENDSVATSEIRYGDNDRLAARVATMVSADLLILLSDIDGLYTAPPHLDENATLLNEVNEITPEIEAMAGVAASELSRGGMVTKIEAGKIATEGGTAMIITSGKVDHPIKRLIEGANATWFAPRGTPVAARKRWIAGHLDTGGKIHIDAGAENALNSGKSLLFAGLTKIEGQFKRGDTVQIISPENRVLGAGLIAYDASDAQQLIGRNSAEFEAILGYKGRDEVIHRDDLVLTADQ